ncbi:hypothetical protein BJY00DRAFT_184747 [Aspergillus carlsbadensis]|nr:hypothetical protein BJY00DRAFT_184747 [Aspergillus carlsbadensis]
MLPLTWIISSDQTTLCQINKPNAHSLYAESCAHILPYLIPHSRNPRNIPAPMKLATLSIAWAFSLPQSLAFSDACRQSLVYCGSTLMKYNGYTSSELHQVIMSASQGSARIGALSRPQDARFTCINSMGGLMLTDFCTSGCTNPPNGDICM